VRIAAFSTFSYGQFSYKQKLFKKTLVGMNPIAMAISFGY